MGKVGTGALLFFLVEFGRARAAAFSAVSTPMFVATGSLKALVDIYNMDTSIEASTKTLVCNCTISYWKFFIEF